MIKSKYNNVKTEYNGVKYDSKKEAFYAQKLDILSRAVYQDKRVIKYERQVPFQIEIAGKKICKYLLDFLVTYIDRVEYVDVKGMRTPIYKLKKKLVEAQFGILIKEV